jgi:hypothetical protein
MNPITNTAAMHHRAGAVVNGQQRCHRCGRILKDLTLDKARTEGIGGHAYPHDAVIEVGPRYQAMYIGPLPHPTIPLCAQSNTWLPQDHAPAADPA